MIQWHQVTMEDFSVTEFFNVKYLKNSKIIELYI